MAKKLQRTTGAMPGNRRLPKKKAGPPAVRIPVDATRATVPIPGLKAGKRKT